MPDPTETPSAPETSSDQIRALLDHRQHHEASMALLELPDPEIADLLLELEQAHRLIAFRLLPGDRQADVFSYLEHDDQSALIDSLTTEQAAQIFNEMDPDDRVDFLELAPEELAAQLMAVMHPEDRAETQRILDYPEESVARDMTTEYLTVRPEWSVSRVLEYIRKHGRDAELLNVLYVVDDEGRLMDYVRIRRLLVAPLETPCGQLSEGKPISLQANADREEAVRLMDRYDIPVLPVVDDQDVLLGIVTFDDVADVAEEEVTEDIHKMGGLEALDTSYMSVSILTLVRKRGVWLMILFIGGLLTVSAMGAFEHSLKRFAVLAMFVPLIIASGGNSGAQAASIMIRALAIGDLELKDWWTVMRRELLSGLMLGSMLGIFGLIAGTWVSFLFFKAEAQGLNGALHFGFAIGTAVVGVVMIGNITGSMLPFILQGIGLDPATSSTPFVATIVDVTGLVIYFVAANLILTGSVFPAGG